ncbi:MAG TPA: LPS export ABC transporter periplasmic protein LptC [Bacteroidota bacterium]|nr:LPS export ABC transporter periplasmic protein LptC [Bacteroidota bacterium]
MTTHDTTRSSLAAGIVIVLMLAACAGGCEEKIKPSLSGLSSSSMPSQESWNTTVTFTDTGVVKAILRTGHLAMYDTSRTTLLDSNVRVDFFDERGRHSSTLTSRAGSVDESTNNLEASGNVVVTSDSGVTVRTEKMKWDNARQRILSDEFVRITSPKEQLQGRGFESDQNLRNYKIFHVTGSAQAK